MAKKLKVKRLPKKRVATRQDLTVRNRRAIDKVFEGEKKVMRSHLESMRTTIDAMEIRIDKLESKDKR